ncbi:hypothetical protein AS29_015555 [Bacillus sp. SJS]|nr:hypothetical protein AS29_015555 [Bacillus sp. SJS]
MARIVDAKTSQNASYANSIGVLVTGTPQLTGQLTLDLSSAGANSRVTFEGTVSLQLPLLPVTAQATATIVRGTSPSDLAVYSAAQTLDLNIIGPQVLSFSGSDFNVPAGGPVTYTMFLSVTGLGVTRVGPESFNAVAYTD